PRPQWPRETGSASQSSSSGFWSFIIGLWRRFLRLAPQAIRYSRKDPAQHVCKSHDEEHVMVEREQQAEKGANQDQALKRVATAQVQVFKTIKAPGAHHQKADHQQQGNPQRRQGQIENRLASKKMYR